MEREAVRRVPVSGRVHAGILLSRMDSPSRGHVIQNRPNTKTAAPTIKRFILRIYVMTNNPIIARCRTVLGIPNM